MTATYNSSPQSEQFSSFPLRGDFVVYRRDGKLKVHSAPLSFQTMPSWLSPQFLQSGIEKKWYSTIKCLIATSSVIGRGWFVVLSWCVALRPAGKSEARCHEQCLTYYLCACFALCFVVVVVLWLFKNGLFTKRSHRVDLQVTRLESPISLCQR